MFLRWCASKKRLTKQAGERLGDGWRGPRGSTACWHQAVGAVWVRQPSRSRPRHRPASPADRQCRSRPRGLAGGGPGRRGRRSRRRPGDSGRGGSRNGKRLPLSVGRALPRRAVRVDPDHDHEAFPYIAMMRASLSTGSGASTGPAGWGGDNLSSLSRRPWPLGRTTAIVRCIPWAGEWYRCSVPSGAVWVGVKNTAWSEPQPGHGYAPGVFDQSAQVHWHRRPDRFHQKPHAFRRVPSMQTPWPNWSIRVWPPHRQQGMGAFTLTPRWARAGWCAQR